LQPWPALETGCLDGFIAAHCHCRSGAMRRRRRPHVCRETHGIQMKAAFVRMRRGIYATKSRG
jgi:hypothetical protein